ncbi:unnamed protein product [Rhodiola kirilowii]
MAPSFDWALSSLLCAEENTGFLDDEISENDGSVETSSTASLLGPQRAQNEDQRFESWDSFIGVLCVQSDECLESMIGKESQHLPECDYLGRLSCGEVDLSDRMRAVIWIKKVHAHFGFGPLSLYLSVNYLDRFLSAYGLPVSWKNICIVKNTVIDVTVSLIVGNEADCLRQGKSSLKASYGVPKAQVSSSLLVQQVVRRRFKKKKVARSAGRRCCFKWTNQIQV